LDNSKGTFHKGFSMSNILMFEVETKLGMVVVMVVVMVAL
jgi:hypothetical protein